MKKYKMNEIEAFPRKHSYQIKGKINPDPVIFTGKRLKIAKGFKRLDTVNY